MIDVFSDHQNEDQTRLIRALFVEVMALCNFKRTRQLSVDDENKKQKVPKTSLQPPGGN